LLRFELIEASIVCECASCACQCHDGCSQDTILEIANIYRKWGLPFPLLDLSLCQDVASSVLALPPLNPPCKQGARAAGSSQKAKHMVAALLDPAA